MSGTGRHPQANDVPTRRHPFPLAVRFAVEVVAGQSAKRISSSPLASTSPTLSIATCGHSGPLVTSRKVCPYLPRRSVPSRTAIKGAGSRSPMDRGIG